MRSRKFLKQKSVFKSCRNALKCIERQTRLALWAYWVALLPQASCSHVWSLRSLGLHASHSHSQFSFAPSLFMFCTCILSCFAPSGLVLCTQILSSFAPSHFVLHTQSLCSLGLHALHSHFRWLCSPGFCTLKR